MTLAALVRKARLSKDVTLNKAAHNLGISPSHLHAIERGKRPKPKMKTLRRLADYYALSYDEICIAAERVPEDIFFKIAEHPILFSIIRGFEV